MKKTLIIFLILVSTIGPNSKANATDTVTQRQEQEKRYRDNMKSVLEAEKTKGLGINSGEASQTQDVKSKENKSNEILSGIYKFDEINLIGNKIYSYKDLKKAVLDKFIDKPINKTNIRSIRDGLFNYYANRGYIVVSTGFDPKIRVRKDGDLIKATFTFIVEENKVGKILLKTNRKNKANDATSSKNVIVDEEKTNRKNKLSQFASKVGNFRRQTQLLFAFPLMKENPLNLKDLDQGRSQMDRLESNSIHIDVAPSAQKGYSDIVIENNQNPSDGGVSSGSRTTFFNLNYSNNGIKLTGEEVFNLNISQDNLLSINDNIYVSYTETANSLFGKDRKKSNISYIDSHKYKTLDLFKNDDKKEKFSKALYGSISFPLGYWTFDTSLSYSTYKATQKLNKPNRAMHTTSKTLSQEYGVNRAIYKTKRYTLNLGTGLEVKNSESSALGRTNKIGNGRSSKGSVYLNNTITTKYGTTFIIKPTYRQGLSLFGAKKDKEIIKEINGVDITERDSRQQYKLANLFLYFGKRIDMPLLTRDKKSKERKKLPMIYTLAVNSQYSFNSLYGGDKISIGGEHTIRGYKDSIISGDNGVYIRQDLKANMFHLMPDALTKKEWAKNERTFLFGQSLNTMLSKVQVCGFYDMGYVRNKYDKLTFNDSYMMGTGISLSYSGKYINSTLTYSRGLHCPEIKGQDKEKQAIYWKIGASW
jgi:hemolysin activation/secretion protein